MCSFDMAKPQPKPETPSAGPKIQVQDVVQRSWWRDLFCGGKIPPGRKTYGATVKIDIAGLVNVYIAMERSFMGKLTMSMVIFNRLCNKLPEGMSHFQTRF